MSFFQKRRPFCEIVFFKTCSEHNALKCKKKEENVVTIKFIHFLWKRFRNFFGSQYILQMTSECCLKDPQNFVCKCCDYITCKKSQYDRHLSTAKHQNTYKRLTNTYIEGSESSANAFACDCGIVYKHRQSLYNHKKKCSAISNYKMEPETITQPVDMSYNIILEIVKQNQEFKELLIEQNKENKKLQQRLLEMASKIGNTNCNNNNKTNNFNLHLFLNEQCKDALNIEEFVNTIKLQLSDLDMIGKLGYTEGMSKIFIRNLKELDICKRPIHCSDLKRETLYVKDKDAWEKENGENIKIKKAIKGIENKNIKQLPQWRAENPSAEDTDTKKHLDYQHILCESMGGSTLEDDDKKHNKIIRNVAKEVIIEK
jgi:hypothetical protein